VTIQASPSRSGGGPPIGVERDAVRRASRSLLEEHWDADGGYTVPNPGTYQPQWLWDSAFHALAWGHLGRPDRAWRELRTSLQAQHTDGFVPHMRYPRNFPGLDPVGLWDRSGASTITQPPIYAHAVAHLAGRGSEPERGLLVQARRGVEFLVRERARIDGLVPIVHPWETGCDDSPRWDSWRPPIGDLAAWREEKVALVRSVVHNGAGSAVGGGSFAVGSIGFNALVAFALGELASLLSDGVLAETAAGLVDAIEARWDGETWVDAHSRAGAGTPTLDALLALLVVRDRRQVAAAFDQLRDPHGFAGAYGLRYVRADQPSYEPQGYWRGSAWMPMQYLLLLAARRWGRDELGQAIRATSCAAAFASGWSEHYDPDTGEACGAAPQAWASLAAVIADC